MDFGDPFQSVRSRTPRANEAVNPSSAPDASGDPKCSGLTRPAFADEMNSSTLLVSYLEQWRGKAHRHRSHEARVPDATSSNLLLPVLKRAGDIEESLVARLRLPENPLASRLTKCSVR